MINGSLRIPCVFRISVDDDWGPMTYGAMEEYIKSHVWLEKRK